MTYKSKLESISDDELLRKLSELLQKSRRIESELVAHIGEVDARRLYVSRACSSMFVYCTDRLHLSEAEAYMRIAVARASRKHPMLLTMLEDGRLHLSAIAKLAPHLTKANREELLARAVHKTKREIEELIAELAPKPDVASTIRKIPKRRKNTREVSSAELRPDAVEQEAQPKASPPAEPEQPAQEQALPPPPPALEPLSPARYKIQFTASAELRDKLQRLQALMRSSDADIDLAGVIEEAVTEKLERLEAKRYGKTKSPRKSTQEADTTPSSRYIPAAVRRTVYDRDGGQCTFVDQEGQRCTERTNLEFDHDQPFALGGDHRPENIHLKCRAHNLYRAERTYGKEAMERYRSSNGRVSEPMAVYGSHRWPTPSGQSWRPHVNLTHLDGCSEQLRPDAVQCRLRDA